MRIGIIGTGGVAQTLGAGFLAKGHDVVLGTRDPHATLARTEPSATRAPPLSGWLKANPKARLLTMAEAAKHGEVIVLAVHGDGVAEAVKLAGPENLAGKLVLDTTNPLDFRATGLYKHPSVPDSCLQVAQRLAPKAKLVKAWNCTPGHLMVHPNNGPGDQLICGDDKAAKQQATQILKDFGWGVADVGSADKAPFVEGAALAVCNYAINNGQDWGWIVKLPGKKV
jgi:8-hydroxy-5-deazaflavin:NADPH oxidoreductase